MKLDGKKVVVTGGAGFVGSHLVEELLRLGAEVLVLDDFSRGTINYIKGAKYLRVDVGLLEPCRTNFKGASVVFNLAASVAGVIYNQSHHAEMFYENIRLQTAPAIAAAEVGVERFVQVSSVCIYGKAYNSPAIDGLGYSTIGEPVLANEGYSWSKRMGELAATWSGIPRVAIVRPSNVFGPRDHFDDRAHVIPALIKKTYEDEVVVLHGDGSQKREFVYVTDVAKGMIAAATGTPDGVKAYNIGAGPSNMISIYNLAKMIMDVSGYRKEIATTPSEDGGDSIRYSDTKKAKEVLGWEATVPLKRGLKKTINWWRHGDG